MRNSVFILLILFAVNLNSQQNNNYSINFDFKAKIINKTELYIACGYLAAAYIIEVEIIESYNEEYNSRNKALVVRCPDFYGEDFFRKDNIYKISISNIDFRNSDFIFTIYNEDLFKNYSNKNQLLIEDIVKTDN